MLASPQLLKPKTGFRCSTVIFRGTSSAWWTARQTNTMSSWVSSWSSSARSSGKCHGVGFARACVYHEKPYTCAIPWSTAYYIDACPRMCCVCIDLQTCSYLLVETCLSRYGLLFQEVTLYAPHSLGCPLADIQQAPRFVQVLLLYQPAEAWRLARGHFQHSCLWP